MIPRFHMPVFIPAVIFLFACESLDAGGTQVSERKLLQTKKQQIIDFINADSCFTDTECRFIAFGSKPCGGAWEYLLYPASIDTTKLIIMIAEYNAAENAYNKKWGVMSDCSVPAPPDSVRCVHGKCVGYYFGTPKP